MKLAINGGLPVRSTFFRPQPFYNKELCIQKVSEIIESEFLSGYRGSFGPGFYGGEYVRKVEKLFKDYIQQFSEDEVYVLAVNSCTSGLIVACGAIGLNPGDEVIVTPWSMTCSATAPMIYKAVPVFADIEKEYFCIDPEDVRKKITKKTKAILAVDLFGQPISKEIKKIAEENNLFVIEDAAQAMGTFNDKTPAGLLGDISCFSFTQGKHFTCGEGGFIVTKDPDLYMKSALIRNHAEAVINSMPKAEQEKYKNVPNMVGFNMRMTEIDAAILFEQLKNIEWEAARRVETVTALNDMCEEMAGINIAPTRVNCFHSFYTLPFFYDKNVVGVEREKFLAAVRAELSSDIYNTNINLSRGVPLWDGYITPIYRMPLFDIQDPVCPVAEKLWKEDLFITLLHGFDLSFEDIEDIKNAFLKVYENKEELK